MDSIDKIKESLGGDWLPDLYREHVRGVRTRAYSVDVPAGENKTTVMHTLLGIELKVGKRRLQCPDLATARFIQVFTRIGCSEFAIPYDITAVSPAADLLESGWQKALLLCDEFAQQNSAGLSKTRKALVKRFRKEIEEIGAGDPHPTFGS